MRRVMLIVGLLLAILAAVVPASGATAAGSAHCTPPGNNQGPKNDSSLPIGLLSARNMSCAAARTAIRRGTFTLHGGCFRGPNAPPCRSHFTTPGFRCTAPRLGAFNCTDHARRFNFAWGE